MKRVVFATYSEDPEINSDDALAAHELKQFGVEAIARPWDTDSHPDGAPIIVRSCWNYHRKPAAFRSWIDRLNAVWNPPRTLAWNMDKRYLLELEKRGCPIAPTTVVERTTPLEDILENQGWCEAVVKPVISASAWQTFPVTLDSATAAQSKFEATLTHGPVLVQEFVPGIRTAGEHSLIFFDGEFSHAVLKQPAAGDFRVQNEYGGSMIPVPVADWIVEQAAAALSMAPDQCLYARVDVVVIDRAVIVMELELIEPLLFLALDPAAPTRFAQAIARRVIGLPP
jgi:glutathione synthase/RimK-type ligase-like ATP-grasp enzyme